MSRPDPSSIFPAVAFIVIVSFAILLLAGFAHNSTTEPAPVSSVVRDSPAPCDAPVSPDAIAAVTAALAPSPPAQSRHDGEAAAVVALPVAMPEPQPEPVEQTAKCEVVPPPPAPAKPTFRIVYRPASPAPSPSDWSTWAPSDPEPKWAGARLEVAKYYGAKNERLRRIIERW